jgi:enoyl-CoA hydratase/carnithine racemase
MNADTGVPQTSTYVVTERRGAAGLITLNRPKALNALNVQMVRDLTATLTAWRDDPTVLLVAIRGSNKVARPGTPEALFGGFCTGGDIRFFHEAATGKVTTEGDAGPAALETFFTEEYALSHLVHTYPKPYIAFMDGVVMGGGLGLCQGAAHTAAIAGKVRIVTERTKMAMPETGMGLFPDGGAGYFLSRCPGHVGEYLALTGDTIGAEYALQYGLADVKRSADSLSALWARLGGLALTTAAEVNQWIATEFVATPLDSSRSIAKIDPYFSLLRVKHVMDALEKSADPWATKVAVGLRKRSPLMLHVTLEYIRKARELSLADNLRMERSMVYHCFHPAEGCTSEAIEGIRALAIDKDFKPKWAPAKIEAVKPGMTDVFFTNPWAASVHPLGGLG